MREIKFRAWDGKQFFYWGFYVESEAWFTGPPNKPSAKHEQFTGLYDKNGKEIYEGDIVDWDDGQGSVWWCEESTGFVHEWQEKKLDGKLSGDYRPPKRFWGLVKMTVIGNIHENPELVEEG